MWNKNRFICKTFSVLFHITETEIKKKISRLTVPQTTDLQNFLVEISELITYHKISF